MGFSSQKGLTAVELVLVVTILAVLSVSVSFLMINLIQDSVMIPNQLNMDMLVADSFDIMIEGDSNAKGLRYSREITLARARRLAFINQDNQLVVFRWRRNQNRLTRSIDGSAQETFPYYLPSGTVLSAPGNRLFTYYDANENTTNNASNVRRIEMDMTAGSSEGPDLSWEGQAGLITSIAVKKMQ